MNNLNEQSKENDEIDSNNSITELLDDKNIKERMMKIETLKADLQTNKSNDRVDKARFSRYGKPNIIKDQSSSNELLDKWLKGDIHLPKEKGFDVLVKSNKKTSEEHEIEIENKTTTNPDNQTSSSNLDPNLLSFLNELRNEVKSLKSEIESTKRQARQQETYPPHPSTFPNPFPNPYQNISFPQNPYAFNPFNPYYPTHQPHHPYSNNFPAPVNNPFVSPHQMEAPIINEVERLNKQAEELERENNKYNPRRTDNLVSNFDPERHSRGFNRQELKHQEEIRTLQNEMEFIKHKKMLEDLKLEVETERITRSKELEHAQFLLDHKQQLQAIKLKQALAKEQKILELQIDSNQKVDDNDSDRHNIRVLSGVGQESLPIELCHGLEIFIDGISIKEESLRQIENFRLVVGTFDRKGTVLSKLKASEWADPFPRNSLSGNKIVYLNDPFRKSIDNGAELNPFTKLLLELQVRSSVNIQNAMGWCIMSISTDAQGRVGSDHFANGLWRLPIRVGISDPKVDPNSLLDNDMGFILLRIVEVNDINTAESWSPVAEGLNSEDDVNSVYMTPGNYQPPHEVQKEGLNSSNESSPERPSSKPPATSRPMSSRPQSARSERDNSSKYVHGLDPIDEKEDDLVPTARQVNNMKKDGFWQLGTPAGPCSDSDRYERGDGVDVYIDSAMNLPDNCTVSRVVIKMLSPDKEQLGQVYEGYADINSIAVSPIFNFKIELRDKIFNPCMTLLVRIDTIDISTMQSVAIGYSALKLFCNRDRVQCSTSNDENIFIASGAFQVPLYSHKVPPDRTFDEKIFKGMPRVPCASVLIRVNPAPKSGDGLSVLSRDDFPSEDWGKLKLSIPAPSYLSGSYDGAASQPSNNEITCFNAKSNYSGTSNGTIDAVLSQAIAVNREKTNFSKKPQTDKSIEIINWMKSIMTSASEMRSIIDYSFSVPYSLDTGLSISTEMLFNMPSGGIFGQKGLVYKVIYSLNPPGLFYKDPPLTEGSFFTIKDDLDQPMSCPSWTDGFTILNPPQLEAGLCLILDIRTLRVEKGRGDAKEPKIIVEPPSIRKSFWSILPLAKEKLSGQGFNYVQTGNFQIPLIEGSVPTDILASIVPIKEVYNRLASASKGNSLKLVPGASIFVRVMNPLLKDLFVKETSQWKSYINVTYLERMVSAASKVSGPKLDQFKFDEKKFSKIKSTLSQLPPAEDKNKLIKQINKKFADTTAISVAF